MKDLPTLQDLFNNAVFKIPDYQRGYSWENQHRLDLLEDLELLNNKGHYTGTIVLKERDTVKGLGKTYTRYDIVDGQQRFTTILILLDTIIKELKKLDEEESSAVAEGIHSIYIKDKGPDASEIYKLELDRENDKFFREAIIEEFPGIKKTIKSHHNLFKAKSQFKTYLREKSESEENYLGFLNSLADKLTQSLIFTLYEVEDDAEVGVIFEVMNDRGKPLSELEKVKNYLIYLTSKVTEDPESSKKMVASINTYWKEILENLDKAKMSKNDDEDRFLRMNFIINFYSELKAYKNKEGKRVSKTSQLANVYKQLKNYFKELERNREYETCYKEIGDYAKSLEVTSSRLLDILYPKNDYAFQSIENQFIKAEIQSIVSKINRMDIKSNILVLMVAIYDRFIDQPEKILELFDLCEIFAFRTYYLVGWKSYSGQNQIYTLACDIYNDAINFDGIITELKELLDYYAPDSRIEHYFFDMENYYEWKGLKYFLFEYEVSKCWETLKSEPQLTWGYLKKTDRKDSIEHILPQSLERNGKKVPYWKERFNKNAHEENLNKLGNLTLTTASENSKLSNKGFDEKRQILKDSDWKINQELGKNYVWDEKKIEKRGKELFEFALKRWGYSK
jgi:uncharacterized protein with ParB-like and HNH nuclease domain